MKMKETDQRTKALLGISNYPMRNQFSIMDAAARARELGYTVKVIVDTRTKAVCEMIVFDRDNIFYCSAADLIDNTKDTSLIKYGTVTDSGAALTFNEIGTVTADELKYAVSEGRLFPIDPIPREKKKTGRLVETEAAFSRWVRARGMHPFVKGRRIKTDSGSEVVYTTIY
ncbi:hypothetical protein [Ruminococcus albus]|nr:hypothetical protein [Ruminococcus albus]MBE6874745.1 hypothetical protein [Ruminococcus albus]MCC3349699.1 hypothetical protein [Ruminococcus albus 8]